MDDYINGLFPLVREYQMRELARVRVDIKDQLRYRKRIKNQLATAYQPEAVYNQAPTPHRQPRRLQRLLSSFDEVQRSRGVLQLPPVLSGAVAVDFAQPNPAGSSVENAIQHLDQLIHNDNDSIDEQDTADAARSVHGSLRQHLERATIPMAARKPIRPKPPAAPALPPAVKHHTPRSARTMPVLSVARPKYPIRAVNTARLPPVTKSHSAAVPQAPPIQAKQPLKSKPWPPSPVKPPTPTAARVMDLPASPSPTGVLKSSSRPESPSAGYTMRSKSRASSPKVVRIFTKDDIAPTRNDGVQDDQHPSRTHTPQHEQFEVYIMDVDESSAPHDGLMVRPKDPRPDLVSPPLTGSVTSPTPSMSTTRSQPSVRSSVTARSATSQPTVSQPAVSQPVVSQPALSQPVVSQPALSQPTVSQPTVSSPPLNSVTSPTTHALASDQMLSPTLQASILRDDISPMPSDEDTYSDEFDFDD
eukprot:TRINITY_DN3067_c0_g1_i1.p1 TRINITY_DN3067_c0_g1~~TRINITY_DN3067_c0_g1_i1.p1  ORF type:complete len:474 (-),score=73.32 TRINITY_DN3067_c0_g1_i1:105-1526(-)